MSVIDLTFDSSEDDSSVFEKQKIIPFSDSNAASGSKRRTTIRAKSKQSPPIQNSRVPSKRIAQATSNLSILDRLSKPIHFDNPAIKEEAIKPEPKEESSDSDSDSGRFLESATLFFPDIGKKTVSKSQKRDSVQSLPQSKRSKTTTPTLSKEKTRSTGYNWNTSTSSSSDSVIYPSLVGKNTSTQSPSAVQSVGKRARKSAVEALKERIMSVFGSTGISSPLPSPSSSSSSSSTVQKNDRPQPLYSFQPLQSSLSNPSQVLSSHIIQTKTSQAKKAQTKATQAKATQAETTQAKATQAKATQAETTQAKAAQAKAVQAKKTQTKTTQARATQAETTQAKKTQAKAAQAETTQAKVTQVKTAKTNTTQTNTPATPTNKAQSKPTKGRSTINSSGRLNESLQQQANESVSSHPSHYQLRRSTRTPVPVKDPYIQPESIQTTKTAVDLRVHTIDTILEMADTAVTGTEDRAYLEMINNCRFLQYVLKSKPSSLLTLYKRFIKTKRFIVIEPEVASETSIIESAASTPIKTKQSSPLPVKKKLKPSPYSPVSTLQSYMTLSIKSFNTLVQEEPICTVVENTRDSFIHILCSCLHSEFDYRSLNSYLVDNHCIKEQWMCEFLCDSVVNDVSIACHLHHYLMWMKKRLQLHLSFFYSFINECFELVSDLIEGHEVKRRGRKPKLDPAQIRREEEEKEALHKAHVLSVISLLRLISSVLLDELQNYSTVVENPENWENSFKKCIQSLWDKTTVLAGYAYLWEQAKSEMVRVLTLITAHQTDETIRKDFIHFIVCSGNVTILSDILLMSPEEQFRVDILEDIYKSKRTLFTSLMKIPSISFMAKQYGFSNNSKDTNSGVLILCLVEKMKKRKNVNNL